MRLTVGPAAWAVVFGCVVLALVLRNVLVAAHRPLGWALAAVVAAAALEPAVSVVSRKVRRGFALPLVLVPVLAIVGLVTWGAVNDLDAQIAQLQRDIPEVAADIEASERFGETARELELQQKADDFAASLQPASSEVGREAQGGASSWFLTLILTVFALGWGPRFSAAALRQIEDPDRRDRVGRVVGRAFTSSQEYVGAAVVLALATGLLAYLAFRLVDLPTPTPLALLVGVGSLMPGVGIALTTFPAAVMAGFLVSPRIGVVLAVGGLVLQVAHHAVLHRTTRGATHPGVAVIVLALIVGWELYGVGGSVVGVALTVFAVALVDAMADEERTATAAASDPDPLDEASAAGGRRSADPSVPPLPGAPA